MLGVACGEACFVCALHSSMYLSTNASNSFLDEHFSRLSSVGVNSQFLKLLFKFKVYLANTRRSNASSSCAVMLVTAHERIFK